MRSSSGVRDCVQLCVEVVDVLHARSEPRIGERSVMGEREGRGAEVGEGEVQLASELALALIGGGRVGRVCGRSGRALVGGVEVAAELAEIEDVSVLAGEVLQFAVELIDPVLGVQEGRHLGVPFAVVVSGG